VPDGPADRATSDVAGLAPDAGKDVSPPDVMLVAHADAPNDVYTARDAGAALDGATSADTTATLDMPAAFDTAADHHEALPLPDAGTKLDSTAVDTSKPDTLVAVGYPCRNDSDCCISIDSCMATAYLYSKGPGGAPPPGGSTSTGGCLACIPPAVQVRCVSGQCQGERIPSVYSGALLNAHCGYVAPLDGGIYPSYDVITVDAAVTIATTTSWHCGS
jgi:hypothetical protein